MEHAAMVLRMVLFKPRLGRPGSIFVTATQPASGSSRGCCAAFSPGTSERRCKCSAQKTKGSRGRGSPPQTLLHDNIRIYEQGPSAAHYTNPCLNLSGVSAGSASILSASGSCASCWEFIASTLGASYSAGDLIEPHGVVRGNEILFAAVPEFDLPGDGCLLLFPAHPDTVAQGGEVGVAAAVNRKLRTGVHTGVALPAHIRLDVEGPAVGGIDVHNVGRANIHTLSAAVATRHTNEGRHVPLSPVSKADVGPISNVGSAGGRCRKLRARRQEPAGYSSCHLLRLLFSPGQHRHDPR